MSKKIYKTRRKRRSYKRSKRTNRKIRAKTNNRKNKGKKKVNKKTIKNENMSGGAFESFGSFYEGVKKYLKGVEIIWDENNSYEIHFDYNTGVLNYKKLGVTREFRLQPRRFSLIEIYDSNRIGFNIILFNDAKEEKDKVTIIFTGPNAETRKTSLMFDLNN